MSAVGVEVEPRTARAEPSPPGLGRRFGAWARNPWGKARFLWVVALGYLAWTLVPVAIAVLFSFNSGRSISAWQGFSTRWFVGDVNSVWQDPSLRTALFNTLRLGVLVAVIAVPFGVAFAVALDRWHGRTGKGANFLMLFSFVTPEIAVAVAVFLFFVQLVTFIGLGVTAQVLTLSMFEMAYPVIIVRARLLSLGRQYEEAGMDLGASPTQTLRRVLMPLLMPAIFASFAVVFATTIDDFVIVQQLNLDASTQTIPVLIYGVARTGPLPSLNALASLTLVASMMVIALAVVLYRWNTRGERSA